MHIKHPIPPFWNKNSRILILGSFPSVKSRETMFFYGHAQNRFWKVISLVTGCDVPKTIDSKKELLQSNCIALWDVIASCEITGSSDASIKNPIPNDIGTIINQADIRQIFVNGKTAAALYDKHILPRYKRNAIALPSTSPANAAWSLERLIKEWNIIKEYL